MKRILFIFILIFSFSFLYGFAPKEKISLYDDYIMLSLDFSFNGQIVQSIDFSVNSKRVREQSNSIKEELDFKNQLIKQIEGLRNEFLFSFALTYISQPNEEFKINKGVLLTPVAFNQKNDSIGFNISFASVSAWNYYHKIEKGESKDKNRNIFLNKIGSEGVFPFSSKVAIEGGRQILVGERYKEKYLDSAKSASFYKNLIRQYNPVYIYNYSSFNNKLRSDSDFKIIDEGNKTHHVWCISNQELKENNMISLYYYSIQKGAWVLFATIGPLLVMGVAIMFVKIKERKSVKT